MSSGQEIVDASAGIDVTFTEIGPVVAEGHLGCTPARCASRGSALTRAGHRERECVRLKNGETGGYSSFPLVNYLPVAPRARA